MSVFIETDYTLQSLVGNRYRLRPIRVVCNIGFLLCAEWCKDGYNTYGLYGYNDIEGGIDAITQAMPIETRWTLSAGAKCVECGRPVPMLKSTYVAKPSTCIKTTTAKISKPKVIARRSEVKPKLPRKTKTNVKTPPTKKHRTSHFKF